MFLTPWYPNETNPVSGIFVREHARAVALFHKVSLIHIEGINQRNPTVLREHDDTLTVFRLRYPRPKLPKTGWLYRLNGVRKIINELIKENNPPQIIHGNTYSSADLAVIFSQLVHIPAVLTEHATSYQRKTFTPIQIILTRVYMNRLQRIIPVSFELQRNMQRYGIHGLYQVISNPVDTTLFYPSPSNIAGGNDVRRILVVALLRPEKRIDFLLHAFSKVIEYHSDLELLIVGDGPERSSLEKISSQLKIDKLVRFLGIKNKLEISILMRESHLLALTSSYENQPSVLIEAMACGLPVVACAVGGVPEVVKPFCGKLVESGNIPAITEGILYVLDHPSEFSSHKIAEYARDEYNYHNIGRKISELYSQVIEEYNSA